MTHWANDFVGKGWLPLGRGPYVFDCYGLVKYVYEKRYGILLPEFSISPDRHLDVAHALRDGQLSPDCAWQQVETPFEGCGVGMSTHNIFHHVGLWIESDNGLVLHAHRGNNVLAQSLASLRAHGWRRIEFYKHKDFPC